MKISRAPLRISLTGGGTDFPKYFKKYNGAVISFSFNKYITILLKKSFDEKFLISYSKKEKVSKIQEINHPLFRETLKYFYKKDNFKNFYEIHSIGDIPGKGSGLGSSSAFCVALVNMLYNEKANKNLSKSKLAELASYIEVNKCKNLIGLQDQYASTYGNFNFIHFSKKKINISNFKNTDFIENKLIKNFFLIPTGIFRSSSTVLKGQFRKINNRDQINILKKMYDITLDLKNNIEEFNIEKIVKNLNYNWLLKKQLSNKISNKKIDNIFNYGLKNGAEAGKLLGAGNGGFLLFYVPPKKHNLFFSSFVKKKIIKIKLDKIGAKLINLNDN